MFTPAREAERTRTASLGRSDHASSARSVVRPVRRVRPRGHRLGHAGEVRGEANRLQQVQLAVVHQRARLQRPPGQVLLQRGVRYGLHVEGPVAVPAALVQDAFVLSARQPAPRPPANVDALLDRAGFPCRIDVARWNLVVPKHAPIIILFGEPSSTLAHNIDDLVPQFLADAGYTRSIEQLRGMEGARVRKTYQLIAKQYGVKWSGRRYDPTQWDASDIANQCLSAATACLYGISEAAILAAGYAPAIGFLHTGKPKSFVYDIADIVKFETVVPAAFRVAARNPTMPEREVRIACRDAFKQAKILQRLIPLVEEVLSAGEIEPPPPAPEAMPPAIPEPLSIGDAGHRSQ